MATNPSKAPEGPEEKPNQPSRFIIAMIPGALFHLFFQWTLQDLTHMLPACCALAFVAQHRKNTWPGIIAHTFGNSPLLLQIFRGISG
jgi:hypothetical protein